MHRFQRGLGDTRFLFGELFTEGALEAMCSLAAQHLDRHPRDAASP